MKKVLIITAAVLLTILVGAGIYVASIDWNRYKDDIASQVSQMSGKKLVFEGPFDFTMFPSPYMVAQNVKIYNSIGEKPIAVIKKMVVDLSLMPLLKGDIDIRHMSFIEPRIEVSFLDDDKLNWQSDLSSVQISQIRSTKVTLNSLTLEKGELVYLDGDEEWKLQNLNAEIIAPNLFGPYRIEGSYIREGNPEGFAISLGQFTENFATSLNLVLTHPQSDSFLRFDGTFLLSNGSINGNVVFESKNIKRLFEHNFPSIRFDEAYNYPLSVSTGVTANRTQADLSGLILKYGNTMGSGDLLLPFEGISDDYDEEKNTKKQLEAAFNFTNLDLTPFVYAVKSAISTYKDPQKEVVLPSGLDVIGDIKAVNATYNEQNVKDLSFSFDYTNQLLHINNLAAALPGDTSFDLKGDFFAESGIPQYSFETSFNSGDLTTALSWLEIKPQISNAGVLRRGNGNAKFSGTNQKMQISPFKLTLDKSTVSGEYAIKFGQRNDSMLVLKADMINFDNYVSAMPKEEVEKGLQNRINYRFANMGFLNDFEMQADVKLDLGIYENLPLENIELKATLIDGTLEIAKLKIANAANMSIEALGDIKGFGEKPAFENLRYNIITDDLAAWLNKMEIALPEVDLKLANNFDSMGTISGTMDNVVVKSDIQLGDLKTFYDGTLVKENEIWNLNGEAKLEHPDFVEMLRMFNINYNPQGYILGRFLASGKIVGNKKAFKVDEVTADIGVNEFRGNVAFDNVSSSRPLITTSADINSFEFEKYIYTPSKDRQISFSASDADDVAMWTQPRWSSVKTDYDFYKTFDAVANLKVKKFNTKSFEADDVSCNLKLNNGRLELTDMTGRAFDGDFHGNLVLDMNNATASLQGGIKNAAVGRMKLAGTIYGLSSGTFSADGHLNSSAASPAAFLNELSGEVKLQLDNAVVKGWNLPVIYSDLQTREVSDGLGTLVRDNLASGETAVNVIAAQMSFNQGKYNFNNLQMTADNMALDASGSGNLPEWSLNSRWNVHFDNLNNLPGFGFAFEGTLANPSIEADTGALSGLYDARQQKIAAEKQAKEDEIKNRLQGLADDQKQVGQVLKGQVDDLKEALESNSGKSTNQLMIQRFEELKTVMKSSETEIADILLISSAPDITEDMLKDLARRNETAMQNLDKLKLDLNKAFLDDVKLRCKEQYDTLVEIYNTHKAARFDFNKEDDNLQKDMKLIETSYSFERDPEVLQMKADMEKLEKSIEDFDVLLEKEYQAQQNNTDTTLWENYFTMIQEKGQQAQEDVKASDVLMQKYLEYIQSRAEAEKKIYNDRIREAEIKKKLEQNTGVISIKKTGKSVVVTRDIDEIEKAEELKANDNVPVLDFSRKEQKPAAVREKDSANGKVIKKGGILR